MHDIENANLKGTKIQKRFFNAIKSFLKISKKNIDA